jgi:hypothetical protein
LGISIKRIQKFDQFFALMMFKEIFIKKFARKAAAKRSLKQAVQA